MSSGIFNSRSVFQKAVATALAGAALLVTSCGKQEFETTYAIQSETSPGAYYIAPQVDILLAEDDSGSIEAIQSEVQDELGAFLLNLETKRWDYHFATTPLIQNRALSEVVGSHYDSNWGSSWTPPYPGAKPNGPGTINASYFRTPDNYTGFIPPGGTTSASNGLEPGLQNIVDTLQNRVGPSNFLRKDALLVVVVVGNGNDTSGISVCYDPSTKVYYPCGNQNNLSQYTDAIKNLKTSTNLVRFYAAVSPIETTYGCRGSSAHQGSRYMQAATALGGKSYDICTQPLVNILNSLSAELQTQKLQYRARYIMIPQRPDLTQPFIVTKYSGGQKIVLKRGIDWDYDDTKGIQTLPTIQYPQPMNYQTGYVIELKGNGILVGDDTADVQYKPAMNQ